MNSFRKLPDGWGVMCDAQHNPGDTVTVTLKDGRTKPVEPSCSRFPKSA
jgi:hypothetical protein